MELHQKINYLLERIFKLRVTRAKNGQPPINLSGKEKNQIENKVVEFMGISGVGKTTLCNYYLDSREKDFDDKIITPSEVQSFCNISSIEISGIYDKLLSMWFEDLATKFSYFPGNKKFVMIRYFRSILAEDAKLACCFNNKIIVLDGGLFHNFSLKLMKLIDDKEIRELLKNKAIIYCWASPDFIFNNVKHRAQTGEVNLFHQRLNDEELYNFISKSLENRRRAVIEFEKFGIPVLKVNTEQDQDYNSGKIDDFIVQLAVKNDSYN